MISIQEKKRERERGRPRERKKARRKNEELREVKYIHIENEYSKKKTINNT